MLLTHSIKVRGNQKFTGINTLIRASLLDQLVKNLPATRATWVQSPGWKEPLEKETNPLQCSGLQNSMGCSIHGVAKSQTRLSDFHFEHTNIVYVVSSVIRKTGNTHYKNTFAFDSRQNVEQWWTLVNQSVHIN